MPGSSDLSLAGRRPALFAGLAGLCLILCPVLAACSGPDKKAETATVGATSQPAGAAGASDVTTANAPDASGPARGQAVATPASAPQSPDFTTAPAPVKVDSSGWVLQPPFHAAGDEPFWRLELTDGWFVFQRSGLAQIEAQITPPKREKGADIFVAPPLTVRIKREACETDGGDKSDASAVVTFDNVDFEGCAFSGAEAESSPEASAVADSIGTIDACLARLGEPALVTGVYPREGGRTAVALREPNGSQFECAAEPTTHEIAFLDQIEPGAAAPYMTVMRFLRSGVTAPPCQDAKDVRSGDTVLGKMLPSKCKF